MAEIKPKIEMFARIKVVGVGGSGGNAVSRMVDADIKGVEYVAVNTDSQALHNSRAEEKVHIGKNLTKGLGAGMNPEVGRQAAEENRDEIQEVLKGTDMVFVACGLGGGTGSGAAPIVAETAKELGALTVAVVTKPFSFEGAQRRAIATQALETLRDRVDALITVPNDRLLSVIDRNVPLVNAFGIVDDVLRQGVQGISDLITKSGVVNVDFADVKTILENSGTALMGIGTASGENRAAEAARAAINSPLLEISIDGAKGVLFTVAGGKDVSMLEISEAANIITESTDPNARVIFGAVEEEGVAQQGEIRITVVATGFDEDGKSSNPYIGNVTGLGQRVSAGSSAQTYRSTSLHNEGVSSAGNSYNNSRTSSSSGVAHQSSTQNTQNGDSSGFKKHSIDSRSVVGHANNHSNSSHANQSNYSDDENQSTTIIGGNDDIPVIPRKRMPEPDMIIKELVPPKEPPMNTSASTLIDDDGDEIDIPAFIRRKMNR